MAQRPHGTETPWHRDPLVQRGPGGTETPLAQLPWHSPPSPACGGAGELRSIRARLAAHRPPSQASAPAASTDQGSQAPRQDSQGLCRRGWTPRAAPEASPGVPGWPRARTAPGTASTSSSTANPGIAVIPQPIQHPSVPTHPVHITDLPCHPTTASKPGERLENWDQSCSPLPEPQAGKPRPALSLSFSCTIKPGLRWVHGHELVATCTPRSISHCWRTLSSLGSWEWTSAPNSCGASCPLSRTTSSPFPTQANATGYK